MFFRYGSDKSGKYIKKAVAYTADEHNINVKDVDSNAKYIIERLHNNGYEAYLVGGSVRDLILGNIPKDFDIATSATPNKIHSIFRNSRVIGKRFRLVHIYFGNNTYEVATFRSTQDGSVGNKYGRIEEDVKRRDFSCNALYYDPIQELLIDYVGGVQDIKNRVIKPIISRKIIFLEDPVRLIRAIKYACATKARIPFLLRWQIKREAHFLNTVSASRLTGELDKIFLSCNVHEIVEMLFTYGLYTYMQPNVCIFLYENKKFRKQYFYSLMELNRLVLDSSIKKESDFLPFLIKDYIRLISNVRCETKRELYSFVYKETRHFIAPMNPEKKALEYSVAKCLKELI